jgi:hypothetical protein
MWALFAILYVEINKLNIAIEGRDVEKANLELHKKSIKFFF